jgi:hypothetical protein
VDTLLEKLAKFGNAQTKKTWMTNGAEEPCFGVKISDMKPLQKAIKKDYALSKGLYDTGVADAMYFAGLIADETKMTKRDLKKWVEAAKWSMISEYTVAWVASESAHGFGLATEWIESKRPHVAAAGWATLASLVGITPDQDLPLKEIEKLLGRVVKDIAGAPNRAKYAMNNFVICVGSYVLPLHAKAVDVAKKLGKVKVDMGDTSCKVPVAAEYIAKVKSAGRLGKKRAEARC